ncbi:MAG: hypothetical protein P8099_01485 [Gemmatimonadota bacterium]|jgi:hypothetical protein
MRRRSWSRGLAFVFMAMVYTAAPAGAAVADAIVHLPVEEHQPKDQRPHQDNCVFCQLLGQHAIASQGEVSTGPDLHFGYVPLATPVAPVRETVLHLPDSRAPPLT